MSERGVDLLGDELVRVDRLQTPVDVSLHEMTPRVDTPRAGVEGPCRICLEKDAQERCLHCEKPVCRDHYWIMLGLCKSCATEEEFREAREGTRRPRPDLDIKWVED